MLALYGHPFSSYTWKALIPFHAHGLPFEFRVLDGSNAAHVAVVATAGPAGKFPVLDDHGTLVFEATAIIEHLAVRHLPAAGLLPADPARAVRVRLMDRVFDNYVMAPMQAIVGEYLLRPEAPDQARMASSRHSLRQAYAWLEHWLADNPPGAGLTLLECAAAPALFYADWVEPIGAACPRLGAWRQDLLARPAIARCVEEARPWRGYFPPGAPDRD